MATLHTSGDIYLHSDPRDDPVDYKSVREHFGQPDQQTRLNDYRRAGSIVPDTYPNRAIPEEGSGLDLPLTVFYGADNSRYELTCAASGSEGRVNESGTQAERTVVITLTTYNVAQNTPVYFEITGIQTEDVEGLSALTGALLAGFTETVGSVVATRGTHVHNVIIAADRKDDGSTIVPDPNDETCLIVLYYDSARSQTIGYDHHTPVDTSVDYATADFIIYDNSRTWYVVTDEPLSLLSEADGTEGEPIYEGYNAFLVDAPPTDPAFKVDCERNEPGRGFTGEGTHWIINDVEVNTAYGRIVTSNNNDLKGANEGTPGVGNVYSYNGQSSRAVGWNPTVNGISTGIKEPNLTVTRQATFPTGMSGGDTYWVIIKEKLRITFTEVGAPSPYSNRTLQSAWCIFQTKHSAYIDFGGGF